jgi:hypothetical protein
LQRKTSSRLRPQEKLKKLPRNCEVTNIRSLVGESIDYDFGSMQHGCRLTAAASNIPCRETRDSDVAHGEVLRANPLVVGKCGRTEDDLLREGHARAIGAIAR